MPKMIFLCVSNEAIAICPCCGHVLCYRDSRIRIRKIYGGAKSKLLIRRMKCSHCRRLHNELPDILAPYKHYSVEVIENVVDEVIDSDDSLSENYPCETTMNRWKSWILRNTNHIDGSLKSIGYRILDFSERLLKSGVSLLSKLREAGAGWLGTILQVIYNSGGFLPT
jgi:transposase